MTTQFKEGFQLLEKVIKSVNDLGKYTPISRISYVYKNCKDLKNLEMVLNHPLTENIVLVSDFNIKRANVISISPELWMEKKSQFLRMTTNSFLLDEDRELALEETYSVLSSYKDFYPILLIFSNEKLKKPETKKNGFVQYSKGDSYCQLNVNLKDFGDYLITDFSAVREFSSNRNELRSIDSGENMFGKANTGEIELMPPNDQPRKNDFNFSFLEGIRSPSEPPKLSKYNLPTSKRWIQDFYNYLRDLMMRVFPKGREKLIDVILTQKTLKSHWIPCFTHWSANPNPGKNYESVETIGDSVMNYCFKFYFKQREPSADQERISNQNQKYMSKKFQSRVSKEMNLPKWLILKGIPADRMDNSEDLLEAFCGTIDSLLYESSQKGGNKTMGYGTIVVYNMMKLIFDDYQFQEEKKSSTEPDRTFVEQTFSGQAFRVIESQPYTNLPRPKDIPMDVWTKTVKKINDFWVPLGFNKVTVSKDTKDHRGISREVSQTRDGKTTVKISILKDYAIIARRYGIDIPPEEIVIGKSTKNTQKIAEKEAYAKGKDFLIRKGMTREWRESQNKKKKRSAIMNMELVYEKAKKEFPEIVEEPIVKRSKEMKIGGVDTVIYQIIGRNSEGEQIVIFTLPSQDQAYEQGVIDTYLGS
jgi:hypothetical protein